MQRRKNMTKHLTVKEKDMVRKAVLGILVVLMVTLAACTSNTPAEPTTVSSSGAASGSDTEPAAAPTQPSNTTSGSDAEATAAPTEASGATPTLDENYPDAIPVFMQLAIGTMLIEETPNAVTAEQAQELLPLWQMFRAVRAGSTPPSLEEIDAALNPILAAMTPEQIAAIKEMQLTQEDSQTFSQANGIVGQGSGPGSGNMQNLSDEERRIRMITSGGKALVDELIRRLEVWAG
jgi:cytoskeletal protein RodZ